jgi:hypothetical protein
VIEEHQVTKFPRSWQYACLVKKSPVNPESLTVFTRGGRWSLSRSQIWNLIEIHIFEYDIYLCLAVFWKLSVENVRVYERLGSSITVSVSFNNKLYRNRFSYCVFAGGHGWVFRTEETQTKLFQVHIVVLYVMTPCSMVGGYQLIYASIVEVEAKLFQNHTTLNVLNVTTKIGKLPVSLCGPHPVSYLYSPKIYLNVFLFSLQFSTRLGFRYKACNSDVTCH